MLVPRISRSGRASLLVGLLSFVGLSLTFAIFRYAQHEALLDFTRDFQDEGASQTRGITSYLNARLLFLEDLARHIELTPHPDAKGFRNFVATEQGRVHGIQALEWAPLVSEAERIPAEARLRTGHPGFTERSPEGVLRPAQNRSHYFPVTFMEPMQGNQAALGYDLGSNPARLAAIETARDSGRSRATEPIALVQETASQAGFLIFVPVYSRDLPIETLEQRRRAFRGVVLGVFRTGDLLATALEGHQYRSLQGELHDPGSSWTKGALHRWGSGPGLSSRRDLTFLNRLLLLDVPLYSNQVPLAGRTLEVRLRPTTAFIASNLQRGAWLVPPVGVLFTGLVAYLFRILHNQKNRAERMARERTQALAESHTRLRAREEQLRLLLDSTAEAIYGLDMKGRCTFCNESLLRMLGYDDMATVIGQNMHELIHHSHADGAQFPVEHCRLFKAFRDKVGTHADDEVIWRADGSSFPVEYWSYPQWRDGEVIGAVVTFIDISERLKAEGEAHRNQAMIENLLDSIPDIVFFKDVNGVYLRCNPPLLELLGRRREEVIGYTDYDIMGRENADICREQDWLMLNGGEPRHNDEWLAYPDGRRALLDILKTPFYGPSGGLVGILGIGRDITARKVMEDGLMEKDLLLDAVSRALVSLLDAPDWQLTLIDFLERLGEGAKASRTYIFQRHPGTTDVSLPHLSQVQCWQAEGIAPRPSGIPMAKAIPSRWMKILAENDMVAGSTPDFPPLESAYLQSQGVQMLLLMPVLVKGLLWGMIGFEECPGLRTWTKAEQEILRLSARALGLVIERQQDLWDLEMARVDLEKRVVNRTRDLQHANLGLLSEMATRHRSESRLTALTQGFLQLGPDTQANLTTLMRLLHELTGIEEILYVSSDPTGFKVQRTFPEAECTLPEALQHLDIEHFSRRESTEMCGLLTRTGAPAVALAHAVWAEDKMVGLLLGICPEDHDWNLEERTLLGIMAAATGIEERRRFTEEDNHRTQLRLLQAQKLESVGLLAAGIAHEINTPIQFLSINLRFLEKTYDQLLGALSEESQSEGQDSRRPTDLAWIQDETPKVLRDSMEGIDRVAKIVRAMKEFSHPGNPDPVAVDLNKSLESAATVSRNEWKYVANLEQDFQSDLPLIQGFPAELNQVFLNLIVNAAQAIGAKAHEAGDLGRILLSTSRTTNGVEIRIQDTGTGILEEHHSKVFDPFFTTKDVGVGTGQGLSVCYQTVVGMHGGEIRFESQPGQGTTFIVQLPLRAAPAKQWSRKEGAA